MEKREKYTCWLCGKTTDHFLERGDVNSRGSERRSKEAYVISNLYGNVELEPKRRVFCENCLEEYYQNRRMMLKEYDELKIKVMFERALLIMEDSNKVYMHEYMESANKILVDAMEHKEKYRSSYEMVTAIILNEFLYDFEINKKIGKYFVDFYIPELFTVLEIDGERHENKKSYDSKRDEEIRCLLGNKWEIIRIKTKYIDLNPEKIPDAIEELYLEHKKIRQKNNGILPEWFDERSNNRYRNILKDKDKVIKVSKK